MVEKNMEYVMDIDGMGYEGEGVGKIDGFTVFVQGAIQGEKIKVKIVKVSKKFAYGRIEEIMKSSPERTEPVCSIYKRCGGCQLQHMSYEAQLDFKRRRVVDCLERIGKIHMGDVLVHDTIGMDNPYRYRNKVELPVKCEKGQVNIGFYARRTHEVIDMASCMIQDETADKIVEITRNWIYKFKVAIYDEKTGRGNLRSIMVRTGFSTEEVMVVLVTKSRQLAHAGEFVDAIVSEVPDVKSIVQNVNKRRENVILGKECNILFGNDTISDYIGKLKFEISPLSFFQVNPVQTEVLYKKALEYANLKQSDVVFDAYCGAGTISLFLSNGAKKVYGVEIVEKAIENAKENARVNKISNAEFITGKSEVVIPEMIGRGIKADVVVVDPPRKGCDESLLHAVAKMQPDRMVYVSCDPGTLARDLGIMETLGYKVVEVQPVDMFPETAHVETIVLIQRADT